MHHNGVLVMQIRKITFRPRPFTVLKRNTSCELCFLMTCVVVISPSEVKQLTYLAIIWAKVASSFIPRARTLHVTRFIYTVSGLGLLSIKPSAGTTMIGRNLGNGTVAT